MAIQNPILLDLPDRIETERLILRVPRAGDGAIVLPSVRASIETLKRWMPWATDAYGRSDAEEWCRRSAAKFILREELQFLILRRSDEQHLGTLGGFNFDWKIASGEIGYWLRDDGGGHGYMTEAVNAVRDLLITQVGLQRIEIRCDDRNVRSYRVAERLGFVHEATLRREALGTDGAHRDTRVYAFICDRPEQ